MARELTSHEEPKKKPKVGSGKRFASLEHELAHEHGVTNPRALAAVIGRKKYGPKKMAHWSAKGHERHEK